MTAENCIILPKIMIPRVNNMVYFFDNYQSLRLEKYKDLLPDDRAERFERFRQTRDKENCLASYLLLKYALKQIGINDFQLEADEYGKPHIKGKDIFFNISHCRLGTAVAVNTQPVGIDIQNVVEFNEKIIERVGSEAEIEFIKNSDDPDRAFTRIWTLKEAAAKCDGRGIRVLGEFTFEDAENRFTKYGKNFVTYELENLFVSVCGSGDFSDIIEIKNLED